MIINQLQEQHKQKKTSQGQLVIKLNISSAKGEYLLLQKVAQRHNWEIVSHHAHLIWNKQKNQNYKYAKTNRLKGLAKLMTKCQTNICLRYFASCYPELAQFYLPTFNLPEELSQFAKYQQNNKDKQFIIKPDLGGEGKGISFFTTLKELELKLRLSHHDFVIQEYLAHPMLLNKRKFDLRFYILISDLNPYTCFLSKEGLVRVCTSEYANLNNINVYEHLTNFSVNKESAAFIPSFTDFETNTISSKQSFKAFALQLDAMGFSSAEIFEKSERVVAAFLRCIYPFILEHEDLHQNKGFALLGLDIILDSQGNPHLLEGNATPSWNLFQTVDGKKEVSPLDEHVKMLVLGDALRIVLLNEQPESYINLSEKYQLQSSTLLNYLTVFKFCQGHQKPGQSTQGLNCHQFCKLASFPAMVTSAVSRMDYQMIFRRVLDPRFETQMDFRLFLLAMQHVGQLFKKDLSSLSQQLMAYF